MWDCGVTTFALFLAVLLAVLWLLTRRRSGLPPGPPLLPFLGNALSMGSDPRVTFKNLRQKYGDIFSVYVFHKPLIVLNGYNVIKEAIVKNADVFSDRPHSSLNEFIARGKGVVGTSGEVWHEQRRFALNTLREFGVGRTVMEDKINQEIAEFVAAVEEEKGQGFDIKRLVHNAVSNVICSTVFGKRFEYTDPLFVTFLTAMEENFKNITASGLLDRFPLVRFLPGDPFLFKKTMNNVDIVNNLLIDPSIKDHINNHDDDNLDDFIHVYLKEMRLRQQKQDTTTLDLENLARTIADLFVAGTETTATTIRWTLVYFLNYPDVQEKCFQEIQENVGQSRRPSMKDKTNLPYVEATILEVLRLADIVPTGVPHAVPHDVQFRGYTFPKGVTVITNLDSVLQDPDVWGDPQTFRPDRFLDDAGKIQKMDEFIPFSLGVVASSGDLWREQRRFALCTLREFGVGRSIMEDKIHDEVSQFLAAMEMEKSEGFDCTRLVHNAACNVICSTAFGRRFEYSDPLFTNFLKAMEECFETTGASCLLNILPMLRFLPGDVFGFKRTMDNVRMIESLFIQPMIEEHLHTHDDNKVDNFIYAYIKEMRHRQKQQESTSLNLENLRTVITDLFVAGSESIATTIRWALVYFLNYPDVQEKCFQEIQESIGQSRQPSMKDKTNLPYVEATIMEVLRHADIAPVSALHTVPHDVHFRGFNFPKGVPVALMLDSVLQDPDVWGDPDRFRPDRFLDDRGKIQKKDEFIPFSLGRRVCLGEAMARMELFLFLTTMLQRFQFVPVIGQMPSLQGNIGLTHSPKPFLIKSIPRVQSLYSQKSNK